jgi:haloacetate dehalogenase
VPDYVRAFTAPGALRAGFDDYRATFPDDLDADEASAAAGQRLRMPLLALWGDAGLPSRLPVLDIWRRYADDVRGQPIPDCGHFLPEERPDELAAHLLAFLEAVTP